MGAGVSQNDGPRGAAERNQTGATPERITPGQDASQAALQPAPADMLEAAQRALGRGAFGGPSTPGVSTSTTLDSRATAVVETLSRTGADTATVRQTSTAVQHILNDASLSPTQKARALELMGQLAARGILTSTALDRSGTTFIESLTKMMTAESLAPNAPEKARAIMEVLELAVNARQSNRQGANRALCAATSEVTEMWRDNPAEVMRLTSELLRTGTARTAGGETLNLDRALNQRVYNQDSTPHTMLAVASGLMDVVWKGAYDPSTDIAINATYKPAGLQPSYHENMRAVYPDLHQQLRGALRGTGSDRYDVEVLGGQKLAEKALESVAAVNGQSTGTVAASVRELEGRRGTTVFMQWATSGQDLEHCVEFLGRVQHNGQTYIAVWNPHGSKENVPPEGVRASPPERIVCQGGYELLTEKEFEERVTRVFVENDSRSATYMTDLPPEFLKGADQAPGEMYTVIDPLTATPIKVVSFHPVQTQQKAVVDVEPVHDLPVFDRFRDNGEKIQADPQSVPVADPRIYRPRPVADLDLPGVFEAEATLRDAQEPAPEERSNFFTEVVKSSLS